jgi:glycosyltransferase involved in cell wall biosynthesis
MLLNMLERPSVIVIQRYMVFYHQELYRKLGEIFTMAYLHSGETLDDLPDVIGIENVAVASHSCNVRGRRKIVWMAVFSQIFRRRPRVVVTEISISLFNTWLLFLLRPILGYKLLFWGHGLEDYWHTAPKLSFGDSLRLLWFRWSDGVIVYGRKGLEDLRKFLPAHPNLVRSPNALNSDAQREEFLALEREGREAVRESLGIRDFAFFYIGRLAEGKGLERLTTLAARLKMKGVRFEMHFIGSGSAGESLRTQLHALGVQACFHGTITDEKRKGRLIYAFDCLLGPGPLGLAIVDSLAYGCPVLALSDKNFTQKHGPEIEYVRNDLSGFLAETATEWQEKALIMADPNYANLRTGALSVFRSECQISAQLAGVTQVIDSCLKTS